MVGWGVGGGGRSARDVAWPIVCGSSRASGGVQGEAGVLTVVVAGVLVARASMLPNACGALAAALRQP